MSRKILPEVVAIGGGTGLPVVLRALDGLCVRQAIVNMVDDGRSTGIIREAYGYPAVGDLRNTIVALARNVELAELFSYRFQGDLLKNHAFGNFAFVAAAKEDATRLEEALCMLSHLLDIDGEAATATFDYCELMARLDDGRTIRGQVQISSTEGVRRVWVTPEAVRVNPRSIEMIEKASLVIIGPGSLFSSVLPMLSLREVREALGRTNARKLFVLNLANERVEARGMRGIDHLNALFDHAGPLALDYVLCHDHEAYPLGVSEPVALRNVPVSAVREIIVADVADPTRRGMHSVEKLKAVLSRIIDTL